MASGHKLKAKGKERGGPSAIRPRYGVLIKPNHKLKAKKKVKKMHVKLYDRKREYFDLTQDTSAEILWFQLEHFHDNWLRPPNGVSSRIWANLLGEILAVNMELRATGQTLLTDTLYELMAEQEK